MSFVVVLSGRTGLFTDSFRENVLECGFELADGGDDLFRVSTDEGGLSVIAVNGLDDLARVEPDGARPFMLFSPDALSGEAAGALKENGLHGVITPKTSHEDLAFLLNRAVFYDKMVKRNPRAPVTVPVVLTSGSAVVNSFASLLSRDGMFIVTMNPLEVNGLCTLKFSLPGREKGFSTEARVIYRVVINKDLNIIANPRDPFKRMVSHPGMAVFFVDMPQSERDEINRFVESVH